MPAAIFILSVLSAHGIIEILLRCRLENIFDLAAHIGIIIGGNRMIDNIEDFIYRIQDVIRI